MPDKVKEAEREAKDALGIPRGKGKRVPTERQKEFEDKVAAILKVCPFFCAGLLSRVRLTGFYVYRRTVTLRATSVLGKKAPATTRVERGKR